MSKISLIIITGLPGTGKTTLGKKLAEEFRLPFIKIIRKSAKLLIHVNVMLFNKKVLMDT